VRLTWRVVIPFLVLDALLTAAIVAAIVSVASGAQLTREPADARAVIDAQEAAWNRGDLEGFMAGYWRDDRLTFYSGDTVTRGWRATLDRYRKRYQSEGKEMGKLQFREVTVEPLGTDAALARGRWHLTMKDGKTPNGLFTLVFGKIDGQWRITHDHTSSAETK
jgi:beta-aspartyl-peptidase (threonine type)